MQTHTSTRHKRSHVNLNSGDCHSDFHPHSPKTYERPNLSKKKTVQKTLAMALQQDWCWLFRKLCSVPQSYMLAAWGFVPVVKHNVRPRFVRIRYSETRLSTHTRFLRSLCRSRTSPIGIVCPFFVLVKTYLKRTLFRTYLFLIPRGYVKTEFHCKSIAGRCQAFRISCDAKLPSLMRT